MLLCCSAVHTMNFGTIVYQTGILSFYLILISWFDVDEFMLMSQ